MTQKRTCALRGFAFLVILATFVACRISVLEASWLIDGERFHVSAHGRTSCGECHGDVSQKKPHPNPGNVNKTLEDFFHPDKCADCHVESFEQIDQGTHGGLTDKSREELEDCIGCHEPHYHMSAAAREAEVDLSAAAEEKCSLCHEYRDVLPRFSEQDERCMACHRRSDPDDPKAAERILGFCFHCHAKPSGDRPTESPPSLPLIDPDEYPASPHSEMSCLVCHPESVQYGHADQVQGDCLGCHFRHDEKVAHDAHLRVSCQACHLAGIAPVKDDASGQVVWRIDRRPDDVSRVHHMVRARGEEACRRCHRKGNSLGAAAMVLPAKGVICMPCHPATLSVHDATTIVALLIFVIGFVGAGSVWLAGSLDAGIERREENKVLGIARGVMGSLFSIRACSVARALLLDGLLQRRLFRQSKTRWAIHSLTFLPFVFRFAWGLAGLVTSLYCPEWQGTWVLLDKDHPATAFLFDLTGVMVILGIVCAVVRGAGRATEALPPGVPGPDWAARGLLAGIFLVGFLLEGMRLAMTGGPSGVEYAFVGFGLSRLFTGVDLTGLYGYVWYAHAILTGAFVACLPFSRMFHMVTVPIALALNASRRHIE